METPIRTIFARINKTLDEVVAPEIDSDYVRGQVYALGDLLTQLEPQIEYRTDNLIQEIKWGRDLLKFLSDSLNEAGISPPSLVVKYLEDTDISTLSSLKLIKERDNLDVAVSTALNLIHDKRDSINNIDSIETEALKRIQRLHSRNIGLVRPMRLDKISRSKKEEA